jgi:hypothetical protein
MAFQICFVRDDMIVGYMGREGMSDEVFREKREEAVTMHDLKSASRTAQELRNVMLPNRIRHADPRELMMFHFVTDLFITDGEKREIVSTWADKYQIKVLSAVSGGAVETYTYEPH